MDLSFVDSGASPHLSESPFQSPPRTVLLASTCWWPFTARIAMRFAALGWRAEALSPAGHPLRWTRSVARVHDYAALRPVAALSAAIAAAKPVLIIPCDDRALAHMNAAMARPGVGGSQTAGLIARSLGREEDFATAARRPDLIRIAREEGVLVAETRPVDSASQLRAVAAEIGLPMVLKVDGTWGGMGVMIAHTLAEAERAWGTLVRRLDMVRTLKRLLVDRDPFYLRTWLGGETPRVSAQRFINGCPANSAVACWEGEVLASSQVEVLRTYAPLGSSTVVRVIEHRDMTHAGERLVRRLGLSGLCGFDFMIEDGTGTAYLIEMNQRATPLSHLPLGPGRDPVAALVSRLGGAPPPVMPPITDNPVIAFFPGAWHADPDSDYLLTAYHDVPWEDTDLVRELVRLPYGDRPMVARLLARLRPTRSPRRDGALIAVPE